jgi:hypothetical protein
MPEVTDGPAPWERLNDEPSKAYHAFTVYRDLGPTQRSLAAVSRDLYGERTGRNRGAPGRVREWSSTYRWRERAEAWDAHLDTARPSAATKVVSSQ